MRWDTEFRHIRTFLSTPSPVIPDLIRDPRFSFLFNDFWARKQKHVDGQPEPVLGPAFGRIRGLTMTTGGQRD
jgi:hypothetical protein